MVLASDYPFWDVMGTMLVFFLWIIWIWILVDVFGDLFRRHDIGGGAKVLWMIFVIFVPYLGVFIYLVSQSSGMADRKIAREREAQQQFAGYVQNAAAGGGGSAAEIEKAKALLDSGAINEAEFNTLKQKALS